MKYILKCFAILLVLLAPKVCLAQLTPFDLQVTSTNETCNGNGAITFNSSNTTSGASIVYNIYLLPNTTVPIATLSASTLSGLVAGTYRVVATQSLGNASNSQQQDVMIINQVVQLSYTISGQNSLCGADAEVIVNITQGIAVSYEIFAGPEIRPLQSSNVFPGLQLGVYQMRVFNNCGEGVVQTFTVSSNNADILITSSNIARPLNCQFVKVYQFLTPSNPLPIAFPLSVEHKVFLPSGGSTILYQTVADASMLTVSQNIPLYPNQYYTYNVKVIDACGNVFSNNGNVVNSNIIPDLFLNEMSCEAVSGYFYPAVAATLVSGPDAPYSMPETSPFTFTVLDLPIGFYSFEVEDVCGNIHEFTYSLGPLTPNHYVGVRPGCEIGLGSVYISTSEVWSSISIVEAPVNYINSLPDDVSGDSNSIAPVFSLNSMVPGYYLFHLEFDCDRTIDIPIYIDGFQEAHEIEVIPNCGSFDLSVVYGDNNDPAPTLWLQKLDPVTNQWGHPVTGAGGSGQFYTTYGIQLINYSINYNFALTGTFRVISYNYSWPNDESSRCVTSLYEFEFANGPKINNVYSFACDATSYDVIVEATGIAPLKYRITTKNGVPYNINNNVLALFADLEPALYNFQVEDACGNILNRELDIPTPISFTVTDSFLCEGTDATLSVPGFPFLVYEWWMGNNTSTILSISSTLTITAFDPATDLGIYHVRVKTPSGTPSCINFVIDHEISSASSVPNAGADNAATFCGNPGEVDLTSYLEDGVDVSGTWSETTMGAFISENIWDATGLNPGIYEFRYTVLGWCESSDAATLTVTILEVPPPPLVTTPLQMCDTAILQLQAGGSPDYSYSWTGPDGFISHEQNPIIEVITVSNSGTYSVTSTSNGCSSQTAYIQVLVSQTPEIVIETACMNNIYTVTAVSASGFLSGTTFEWTGPENFSATGNPAVITREAVGNYEVTVTMEDGCSKTSNIDVASTMCSLPLAISPNNDGANDNFDLDGFDVMNLKLFNRYGMVVYEQENYVKEWNGQDKNGNELPTATYFYVANLRAGEAKTGWVYLMRK
ncbi:MAG TPA: gliding motility-associated C-terminal domain-containing protein [Flavobacterium sp.]|jgi:gliding motility-associated-like protein